MKDLVKQISDTVTKYSMMRAPERVLCAVSGGADSVCLLLALKELGFEVCAVHVEHGIRGEESLEDCAFVRALCRQTGADLTVRHIDAPALSDSSGRSLEEASRDARYRIFRETAQSRGIRVIATAHHRGDQAETVLWNLARGSSLDGLCGILPVRDLTDPAAEGADLRIVRPLLKCGKDEIEDWLKARGQAWRVDRTNQDPSITRNAIRMHVIPCLEEQNGAAQRHIAQTAEDLAQVSRYLDSVTDKAYAEAVRSMPGGELQMDLQVLRDLPEVIAGRLLHRAAGDARGGSRDITREHVQALFRLSRMDNGKRISLPGGILAVREEGILALRPQGAAGAGRRDVERTACPDDCAADGIRIETGRSGRYVHPSGFAVTVRFGTWSGGEVSKKKYTKTLAYDTMTPYMTLRTRRDGDWLAIDSAGGRKKLKSYLIDEKIPRDRRDGIFLIAQGSHVLWVIGGRISEAAKVTEGVPYAEITAETEEPWEI